MISLKKNTTNLRTNLGEGAYGQGGAYGGLRTQGEGVIGQGGAYGEGGHMDRKHGTLCPE